MVVDGIIMGKGLWYRYLRGYKCCVAWSSVPDNTMHETRQATMRAEDGSKADNSRQ